MKEANGLLNTINQAGYSVMRVSGLDWINSDGKERGLNGKKIPKGSYLAAAVLVYLPIVGDIDAANDTGGEQGGT